MDPGISSIPLFETEVRGVKMLERMAGILFSEKPCRDQEVSCHPLPPLQSTHSVSLIGI